MSSTAPPDFAKRHSFGSATDTYDIPASATPLTQWPMALASTSEVTITYIRIQKDAAGADVLRTVTFGPGLFPLAVRGITAISGGTVTGLFVI